MIVVDASAVMALMLGEIGADLVMRNIQASMMSAINVSECCARGVERGATADDVLAILRSYEIEIVPFDLSAALLTAELREPTRAFGASIGDRACLALGRSRKRMIYTSDRRMAAAGESLHLDILLIR
jgi:PIN domain nuclease of toxin-antitoxin system